MPITVSWGNIEKTYTYFKFSNQWTWEEYYQSIRDGYELVKDIPYTVNILIDVSDCNLVPSNLLSHFGSSMQHPPKPFDLAVIVTASRFLQVMAQMVDKISRHKVKFKIVKTLEEAQLIFSEYDTLVQSNAKNDS